MQNKKSYGKETDLVLKTWVKLARASSLVHKKSMESIRSFGLTQPQFSVIETLGHLGPLKIGVICDKMLVSGGNMTLVLDNLEKNNLIERVPSKEDRRAILVKLTEKGEKLFNQIFIVHAENIRNSFKSLDEIELELLGALLKKLGISLKENGK